CELFRLCFVNRDLQGLQSCSGRYSMPDFRHGVERSENQTGANQQNQRESYLYDNQSVARAVLLTALAIGAAAFANSRAQARSSVFENGNRAEEYRGKQRSSEREQQNRSIDAD